MEFWVSVDFPNPLGGELSSSVRWGTAIQYSLNLKKYMLTFLEDGRLELTNNSAERSIKAFVIGRKNWLFCNTPAGASSSAIVYSIIETAKKTT